MREVRRLYAFHYFPRRFRGERTVLVDRGNMHHDGFSVHVLRRHGGTGFLVLPGQGTGQMHPAEQFFHAPQFFRHGTDIFRAVRFSFQIRIGIHEMTRV